LVRRCDEIRPAACVEQRRRHPEHHEGIAMFASSARFVVAIALLAQLTACASARSAASSSEPAPVLKANVISADVIASAGAVPLEELIADRVPGVTLGRGVDGRALLRIRGTTSWWSNNQPLYVVDGFPLMSAISGPPMFFNSADILRLEVLKDAASTAIYGSHGAAGVILIETKKR
jgi:TonB-dependent SusC/RagA subfamily outer membrane receptor